MRSHSHPLPSLMAKLCDPTAAVRQPGRLLEPALGGPQTLRPRLTTGLPFSPAHQRCACRPTSLLIGYKFATIFEVVGIFFRHFSCASSPFSSCSSVSPRPTLLCCSIHRSAWKDFSAKLGGILCCAEATALSEYQLILRLPQAKLVANQHQGLLYR